MESADGLLLPSSPTMGSMALIGKFSFPTPVYKISKAALNMLMVQYALAFAKEGFTFVALSPGVSIGFLSSRLGPCLWYFPQSAYLRRYDLLEAGLYTHHATAISCIC